jgi:hypothetical protein
MLKTLSDLNTAPKLQELLLEAIKVLLDGRSMMTIRSDPAVAHVFLAQREIGWHQILKGRFSQEWKKAQDRCLGPSAAREENGSTWMIKIIEVWLSQWLKLWKLRNEDRHGCGCNTQAQAEGAQAHCDLKLLYDTHNGKVAN